MSCFQILSKKKKKMAGQTFAKSKKLAKVQVYIIRLNQKRSNTYNQSIENNIVTQNILIKSKMRFS